MKCRHLLGRSSLREPAVCARALHLRKVDESNAQALACHRDSKPVGRQPAGTLHCYCAETTRIERVRGCPRPPISNRALCLSATLPFLGSPAWNRTKTSEAKTRRDCHCHHGGWSWVSRTRTYVALGQNQDGMPSTHHPMSYYVPRRGVEPRTPKGTGLQPVGCAHAPTLGLEGHDGVEPSHAGSQPAALPLS